MSDLQKLRRPTRENNEQYLFDVAPTWKNLWWNMPEFSMENAAPTRRITVNFITEADYRDFQKKLGVTLSENADSMWWPTQDRLKPKQYVWVGTPSDTHYPVYIPTKGRYDCATTPGLLNQAGVKYYLVVEPQEEAQYKARFGDCVLTLPFSNLGQGSIPARNWIWEHAKDAGHAYHWIIDDNILGFWRCHANRRLVVKNSSAPLRVVEDFAERYDNLAFAGLSADGFCPDRNEIAPFTLNTRVYSVTLINTSLPYRWRGRYNEDTDICLRALKDGWATVLFRAMLMKKAHTSRGDGKTGMQGGNSDQLYNGAGDYRAEFAESLQSQHPDVVNVVWKFGRWHHQVNYAPFVNNELRLKSGVTPNMKTNEYGLRLFENDGDGA